ncbi:MAG: M20/M25/M40 family metallo-hydrolase [Lachnospiraceae bacterium]|nr:M20/M25/M40 family metallo-hydrolase [Lachnospiraceae bacterium]
MNRIWNTFKTLTTIDSLSLQERTFCDTLTKELQNLGVETFEDSAGKQLGGNTGNLYGFYPGALKKPPLLLSAHMDTVTPGIGKQAVVDEKGVITSAGKTILGADDVSGIVVILETLKRLKESGQMHRPIELLFTVAEEVYCLGSAIADYNKITAKESYTLDLSGCIGDAANAAPTVLNFIITVKGKAAHAGFAPHKGIHAIKIATDAIAQIELGEPTPGLTVNIGTIHGGLAGNIVPEQCSVTGEIRSLNHQAVLEQWELIQTIFDTTAKKRNGHLDIQGDIKVTAYETPKNSAVVERFVRACQKIDITANIKSTLGASDQNNFALHGIAGIVVSCSMHQVHSTDEFARLDELEQGVALLTEIILDCP